VYVVCKGYGAKIRGEMRLLIGLDLCEVSMVDPSTSQNNVVLDAKIPESSLPIL